MLNAARKEPVETHRGKGGNEGLNRLSFLHLRSIIKHLPHAGYFEKG